MKAPVAGFLKGGNGEGVGGERVVVHFQNQHNWLLLCSRLWRLYRASFLCGCALDELGSDEHVFFSCFVFELKTYRCRYFLMNRVGDL